MVQLCFVEWLEVGVLDTVVVVGCVLDKRVVPSVADENGLEFDVVGSWELAGGDESVLGFDVPVLVSLSFGLLIWLYSLIEYRPIMPAVALGGEIESMSGILRHCTHEALQRPPHAGCGIYRRIGGVLYARI